MKKISSKTDLQRYVSDISENLQMEHYILEWDDLIGAVTDKLYDLIHDKYGFKFGDEMIDLPMDEYWDLYKEFDKE